MEGSAGPIRWTIAFTAGIIAEGLTLAVILLVLGVTGHGTPPPGGGADPVAGKLAALVHLTVGSLMCYLMGWWAARRAGTRFDEHGTIVGATGSALTGIAAITGTGGPVALLVPVVVLFLAAGKAGGRTAARMTASSRASRSS